MATLIAPVFLACTLLLPSQGAAFHYVSSAPWQLAPEFSSLFKSQGLPGGSMHLKDFDIRNRKVIRIRNVCVMCCPNKMLTFVCSMPSVTVLPVFNDAVDESKASDHRGSLGLFPAEAIYLGEYPAAWKSHCEGVPPREV